MFDMLRNVFQTGKSKCALTKDEVAEMLKMSPEAYEAFEKAYASNVLQTNISDNFFDVNAKQAAEEKSGVIFNADESLSNIINRIVGGLVSKTDKYIYDGYTGRFEIHEDKILDNPVTNEEILSLPEELRPQLTESLMKIDVDNRSSDVLLMNYREYLNAKDEKTARQWYHMFRQGLDILDYDEIMYEMIGTNPNSMGHWFPKLIEAAKYQDFFKIPKTVIIKVPMPVLQLTRISYENLTRTTLDIVDNYCYEVFGLNPDKEYFIKTGTYSSKFDFRNAYVHEAKEIRELGEYLLFIHYQANQMASPFTHPCIYGVSTTNEWVVREFIPDRENNPCIYKGLPLHTEYRVFVDFDEDKILGIAPYWKPDVMEQRFGHEEDADSPHNIHDYVIYKSHEETLMKRYEDNKDLVCRELEKLILEINLAGQWSLDIMQNGDDFWIIDMALAKDSALSDCIPECLLKPVKENWLPDLSKEV